MALILSAASGNFNAGATWVGGVVPTVGDEGRASNGHTITITANANCNLISNLGTGNFVISNGVTFTANITSGSSTANSYVLRFLEASPAVAYVVGNVVYATTNAASGINNAGTGTLTLTGNVSPGGLGSSAFGVNNTSSGVILITGNCTGATWTNSLCVNNNSIGSITITGNVIGGNNVGSPGVNNATTGPVTIVGNVSGGTVSPGLLNNSTGTITLTGELTASTAAHAVTSTNASAVVRVSGSFIHASNGVVPVNTTKFILLTTPTAARTRYALNGTGTFVDMFTADNTGLGPATNDVRSGVTYSGMTGSLAVPLPSQVAVGVATDDTVGTAALTADNLRAALGLGSANLDSQLAVLSNLDAAVSSRLAPNGTLATVTNLTNAPASVTPSDIWSHATRTITGGLVDTATTLTNAPTVPSVIQIRQEMDSNSTKLANLDATVSSRLASSAYSAAPTTAQIATAVEGSLLNEADGQAVLNAIVGAIGNTNLSEVSLVAAVRADLERVGGKIDSIPAAPTAAANATAVWSAATKQITGGTVDTLTNSPSVPSAASIASATRSELTTELGRLDAAVSTRLATSGYTAPSTAPTAAANASAVRSELTVELAKVAALNTDRLANVATTAIVGNLIAQANS